MKSEGEIVEILAAYDLTRSFRAAAELAGTDHHTVARYVARRDAGLPAEPRLDRDRLMDGFRDKLVELVEASNGHVRADVAHDKLVAMGYQGSGRTTRRETAAAKRALRSGQRRVFRPWIPEPGGWLQFDWGASPTMNRPGFAGGSEPTEGGAMPAPRKYSNELRERAKRLVAEAACRRGLRARAGTVVERGGAAYRPACRG